MNIILSDPKLTKKERTKCVNKLAGVITHRRITRDRSILEVAADVTKSSLSSRSPRVARQVRPLLPRGSRIRTLIFHSLQNRMFLRSRRLNPPSQKIPHRKGEACCGFPRRFYQLLQSPTVPRTHQQRIQRGHGRTSYFRRSPGGEACPRPATTRTSHNHPARNRGFLWSYHSW